MVDPKSETSYKFLILVKELNSWLTNLSRKIIAEHMAEKKVADKTNKFKGIK